MSPFVGQIHRIYDQHSPCIYPYIGAAFREPGGSDLRIMAVGINPYSDEKDWGKQAPGLYAEWFVTQRWRFHRGAWRDLKALGASIARAPFLFANRTFVDMRSIFLTNAVKVYVRVSEGKRADQLSASHFVRHLDQWRDELDAMADNGVLPHVVAILGDPFWKYACDSFRLTPPFRRFSVKAYRWCKAASLHFANRVTLEMNGRNQELLLVRLRHPAGRSRSGSPKWLFEQEDFRQLASA